MVEIKTAPAASWQSSADHALNAMLARVFTTLRPPPPLTPLQWVEKYRILSREEAEDYPGKFDTNNTPALRGILAAIGRRGIKRIVVQKAAQQGYTGGVVCTTLAYFTHWRPCVQIVMFPRIQSAKDFDAEKFSPMVRATPVLSALIRLKSRADGNSTTRKSYPGGRAKFVASNSPSDVKSTSAKIRIVEEPDDTNKDIKGQGNSITLLRERGKTIKESFELIGGTPTAKGASEIEREMRTTDQRRFLVACHHCDERHEVHPEHIHIPGLTLTDEDLSAPDIDTRYPQREVYGRAQWEKAYYACPHCGGVWTDAERINNMRIAAAHGPDYGWEPTAQSEDHGHYMNELQSTFEGSYVPQLAKKFLEAKAEQDRGDPTKMVAYWNSTRGECWEYRGELPEESELEARAEDYPEWSTPAGGLIPLMSVDVQHDRLAVQVWCIGRGEEMWLVYWGELHGNTIVPHQGAWLELEQLLTQKIRHASGALLTIAAVGIDCSDGQTSDASYSFCRKHHNPGRKVIALKGASDAEGRVEIWSPPKAIDPNNRATKASKFGIQVHIVGTAKAKDLILGWAQHGGRIRLGGNGGGRMHWYKGVRPDWYEQMLSEMKIPSRTDPNKRIWKHRLDRRNEGLDCCVYAVYLCRMLRLHLMRPAHWDSYERGLLQVDLLGAQTDQVPAAVEPPKPTTQPLIAPSATALPPRTKQTQTNQRKFARSW